MPKFVLTTSEDSSIPMFVVFGENMKPIATMSINAATKAPFFALYGNDGNAKATILIGNDDKSYVIADYVVTSDSESVPDGLMNIVPDVPIV